MSAFLPTALSRSTVTLALVAAASINAAAQTNPPTLAAFSTGDGAYYTTIGGNTVDPYFINKSFIIAMKANAPLQTEFTQWLQWLLPRQRKDGGFDRYCFEGQQKKRNVWRNCMKSDADDSMASTTMEMIAIAQQKKWLAAPQQAAARQASINARKLLNSLHNPKTQIYKVFADTELYSLMDNAEVYDGLRAVGDTASANKLATAVRQQFYINSEWKPSIPDYDQKRFYPHTLAHAYLWSNSILPPKDSASTVAHWLAINGNTWLNRSGDHFAWGLVAWALYPHAPIQAACWRASLRPFNADKIGWTVLDAFIDHSLQQLGVDAVCPIAVIPALSAQ